MNSFFVPRAILLAAFAMLVPSARVPAAENLVDAAEMVRATYRTDRETFLKESMQLSESESAAFWPLYRSYRADMEKLGDGLLKLVLEYADVYPNVPEDRAQQLLRDYTALEEKLAQKRARYLKRAAKSLPASKVLRWAQLENRMDLGLRLQLAGTIPLVPTSKQ